MLFPGHGSLGQPDTFQRALASPSELRWQSGRLLTDRSLVRSQVVAIPFFVRGSRSESISGFWVRRGPGSVESRTHGATAARRIPDPKVGGSNPSGFISFFNFCAQPRPEQRADADASALALPPERRWQSGRLLTDRSLVRSQVVA